jgi:hypothetical protein
VGLGFSASPNYPTLTDETGRFMRGDKRGAISANLAPSLDEALSPAGLLDDKDPAALFADSRDRLWLSTAEVGGWVFGTCSQQLQSAIVVENSAHGHDPRSVSKDVSASWGNERIETPR